MHKLICFFLLLHPCLQVIAQLPVLIEGNVKTAKGEPIPHAVIQLKRSGTHTITDAKGIFHIGLSFPEDSLVITCTGYMTGRWKLTPEQTAVSLVLQAYIASLDEVIVSTGYQDMSKERATGAFEKITADQLHLRAGTSLLARLEGVSAIAFDKNSNRPPLTIRGFSSIESSKDPLIILDNFPYEGNLSNINPNDVESITILKDAAAASIWGAKAGNGVIVINTVKGKFNQPLTCEVNANVSVIQKPNLFYKPLISSSDFINVEQWLFSKGYYNSVLNANTKPAVSPVVEILAKQQLGQLSPAAAQAQIDALRSADLRNDMLQYLYGNAVNRQYSLSLKGGGPAYHYTLFAGYDDNLDQLTNTYRRYNLNLQNTWRPSSKWEITTAINYTLSSTNSGKPAYSSLNNLYPYAKLADTDGKALAVNKFYRRAYTDTAGQGKLLDWNYYPLTDYLHAVSATRIADWVADIGIRYQLVKSVQLSVKYRYEEQQTQTINLNDQDSYYTRDMVNRFSQLNRTTGILKYIVPLGAIQATSTERLEAHKFRAQLNFTKATGHNNYSVIAGSEITQTAIVSNGYSIYGLNTDVGTVANVDFANAYPNFITGATGYIPSGLSTGNRTNRFVSLYANAANTYRGKYTISFSARKDASNIFGQEVNQRWQPLCSAGFSWKLSKEHWYVRNANIPDMNLRLTYGISGNTNQLKSAVTTIRYSALPAGYTNLPYASVVQFANPYLRWEKVRLMNAGFDFSFKQIPLSGSIDVFDKKATDLFGQSPSDYTTGTGITVSKNIADMKGNGIECTLNSVLLDKGLQWKVTLLANYVTNKVTGYYVTATNGSAFISDGQSIKTLEGKPLYSILTYRWQGLDANGNPMGWVAGNASTDYAAITGSGTQKSDLVYNGAALPVFFGSFVNTLSYKGFSVTAGISCKAGYYFLKQSVNYNALFLGNPVSADFAKRWQQPGDEHNTYVPAMVYPANNNRDLFYTYSSVLVRKGDHIRLEYVNLQYDVTKITGRQKIFRQCSIYLNMANLGILWRANKDGIDPDYDATIPPPVSITGGIRASF